jgi:hypothetical protein
MRCTACTVFYRVYRANWPFLVQRRILGTKKGMGREAHVASLIPVIDWPTCQVVFYNLCGDFERLSIQANHRAML